MDTKYCTKCNEEKNINEFYTHNKNKNLFRSQCKLCMNTFSSKYKKVNKENIQNKNKEYFERTREINKIKCKEYKEKNPEWFKNWLKKNKDKRKKYINNYNSMPINKIKNSLRARINGLMNGKYKNPKTIELLGCDYEFLIKYIENKFTDGMSWENYGFYGWHIDHIIPLSYGKNEDEIRKLFHYTNLQPLWRIDNLRKNNKM